MCSSSHWSPGKVCCVKWTVDGNEQDAINRCNVSLLFEANVSLFIAPHQTSGVCVFSALRGAERLPPG